MPVPLYLDVHVPLAIAEQLRRRGVVTGNSSVYHARAMAVLTSLQYAAFERLSSDW